MVDTQEPSGWFLLRPVSGFQMAAFSCMVPFRGLSSVLARALVCPNFFS